MVWRNGKIGSALAGVPAGAKRPGAKKAAPAAETAAAPAAPAPAETPADAPAEAPAAEVKGLGIAPGAKRPGANKAAAAEDRAFLSSTLSGNHLVACLPSSDEIVAAGRGRGSLKDVGPDVWREVDAVLERIHADVR